MGQHSPDMFWPSNTTLEGFQENISTGSQYKRRVLLSLGQPVEPIDPLQWASRQSIYLLPSSS